MPFSWAILQLFSSSSSHPKAPPSSSSSSPSSSPSSSFVPDDFGLEGGTEISNKKTILSQIDRALGVDKPPDIEYLLVMPFAKTRFFGLLGGIGMGYNSYGHAAVRYTMPDTGESKVMNIVGKKDATPMVQFHSAEDYLFSCQYPQYPSLEEEENRKNRENRKDKKPKLSILDDSHENSKHNAEDNHKKKTEANDIGGNLTVLQDHIGGEQRGIYNRNIISVRVENVPAENIIQMDKYFVQLRQDYIKGTKTFNLAFGPIYNFLAQIVPTSILHLKQRGNCAKWTSSGLEKAKVVTNQSMWPKSIWINIFENYEQTCAQSADNIHVVSYQRPPHAHLSYGTNAKSVISAVAPLQSLRSLLYYDLEKFANVIVSVPEDGIKAQLEVNPEPKRQSWWRNQTVNNTFVIWSSVFVTLSMIARLTGAHTRIAQKLKHRSTALQQESSFMTRFQQVRRKLQSLSNRQSK